MITAAGADSLLQDEAPQGVSSSWFVAHLFVYLLVGQFTLTFSAFAMPNGAVAISPFAVEPEMARWARDTAGRGGSPERILERLAAAVARWRSLGVRPTELTTGTAREVFHSRRANCAGFAFLVSALARSLRVAAMVVEVSDLVRKERRGGFAVRHLHLAVGVWKEGKLHVVDHEGVLSPARHRFRALEDRTAVAIFHSNRGAEMLLAGQLDGAMAHLERAVEMDPRLESAWGNLRVVCRRASGEAAARCRENSGIAMNRSAR